MALPFDYDSSVLDRYPTIRAGVIIASGLTNRPSPQGLRDRYAAEQQAVIAAIGETPLSEIPAVAAWRRAFSAFGVKPTQYRSAIESLLRRLTKKGDVPSISTLVDTGNLVSIRHRLPIALLDRAHIAGTTTVRFADGDERFTDLGSSETIHPEPGEIIFTDEDDVISARRWCWRQSAASATRPETSEVLITVEGHHDGAEADVAAALGDLRSLLSEYQPDAEIASVAAFSPETGWQLLS